MARGWTLAFGLCVAVVVLVPGGIHAGGAGDPAFAHGLLAPTGVQAGVCHDLFGTGTPFCVSQTRTLTLGMIGPSNDGFATEVVYHQTVGPELGNVIHVQILVDKHIVHQENLTGSNVFAWEVRDGAAFGSDVPVVVVLGYQSGLPTNYEATWVPL